MSTEIWKLEKDLCRCCHSEGFYKNLSEPCNNLGQQEIYADMIRECFDIDLAPVPGMICTMTYMICDACIFRLRDAFNFKKQVLACESRFSNMYSQNLITMAEPTLKVKVQDEVPNILQDGVKAEISSVNEDGTDDDFSDSLMISIDKDDDSDDETLHKHKQKSQSQKPKAKKSAKRVSPKKKGREDDEGVPNANEKKKDKRVSRTIAYYNVRKNDDGTEVVACSACMRTYKTVASAVQHYRYVHLKLRPKLRSCFYCEIKVPCHLKTFHMEEKHGIPAPTCGACGKKFAFPFQVLRHQKTDHMGEKKYSCNVCDMRFTHPANLSQHLVKHSAVGVHKCQYCEKAFKWKKNLRTHIKTHLNDKRHVCHVCNEAFVQQTSLKYHISKRHPESLIK